MVLLLAGSNRFRWPPVPKYIFDLETDGLLNEVTKVHSIDQFLAEPADA